MTKTTKMTCTERDDLLIDPATGRVSADWLVYSSLTDAYGEFGEPRIETTWERSSVKVLDVRHPRCGSFSPPDRKPCEHYLIRPHVILNEAHQGFGVANGDE